MQSIKLDDTIANLYRKHGIESRFIAYMHCVYAHMDLHPEFPHETVYPEDEEPFPYSGDEEEKAQLRKIVLGVKPLKRVFVLRDMEVIFLGPNAAAENIKRVLNQLVPEQRPHL